MLGRATFTTVLSSITIARAKHIVSNTMPFSRAFSPSNPNNAHLSRSDNAVTSGRRSTAVHEPNKGWAFKIPARKAEPTRPCGRSERTVARTR